MKTFQEMKLAKEIEQALKDLKFTQPTEIQAAVIPVASNHTDLMACAETGSGKTAAYGIPIAVKLLAEPQQNALILAPTRELTHQISDFIRELTKHCPQFRVTSLVGGADMRKQVNALRRKPRIIVATPGRLIDHLKRKSLRLNTTHTLVLDEGDRMLDMGFAPQLDQILKYLPEQRQTMLFTATLPPKVQKLAEKFLNNPEKVSVGRVSQPVSTIKQSVVLLSMKEKDDRIVDELNKREGSVIIFARTQRRTDILARILTEYGFKIDLIHGGRSQGQRNRAIQSFRQGRTRILCATDIAARGIDVPQVRHVINYDLPRMDEDYVHRIGRTARNGADGEAVSFVQPDEIRSWQFLARKYQIKGVELKGAPSLGGRGRSGSGSEGRGRPSRRGRARPGSFRRDSDSRSAGEFSENRSGQRRPFKKKNPFKKSSQSFEDRSSSQSYGDQPPRRSSEFKGDRSERRQRSERTDRGSFQLKRKKTFGSGGFKKKNSRRPQAGARV